MNVLARIKEEHKMFRNLISGIETAEGLIKKEEL